MKAVEQNTKYMHVNVTRELCFKKIANKLQHYIKRGQQIPCLTSNIQSSSIVRIVGIIDGCRSLSSVPGAACDVSLSLISLQRLVESVHDKGGRGDGKKVMGEGATRASIGATPLVKIGEGEEREELLILFFFSSPFKTSWPLEEERGGGGV